MKKAADSGYDEVLRLAHEIEKRLDPPMPMGEVTGHDAYGLRLAQALTRSLIAQLDELRKFHAA